MALGWPAGVPPLRNGGRALLPQAPQRRAADSDRAVRLISANHREEVERLLREGFSARTIAGLVGVSKGTVLRYRRHLEGSPIFGCHCERCERPAVDVPAVPDPKA